MRVTGSKHESQASEPGRESAEGMLARFAAGDESAFSELVDLIGGQLYGFICRFLSDRHTAEDVFQIVLVKIARNASGFDGRASFATWSYRIARNACLDQLRKRKRDRTTGAIPAEEEGSASPMDNIPSGTPDPSDAITREELGARINSAVETLPDEQKEVFLLKENGGLTFDEIGQLIGCGKETAKSRMRYALQKLQAALGAEARLYGLTGAQ
ncbi:MAG: sigma-70 family RNA polymerase sigma factor [Planctomycetes bacterium]|nr:sigma-70 family RNA polymerase sigma factor [Planctomycetota bacterium]